MSVEEIRVFNSEINTHFYLYVRRERMQAFYDFIRENRQTVLPPTMPGLSGRAIAGLDAIFDRRPLKFPVHDLLAWFCSNQAAYLKEPLDPKITVLEIEAALERFSSVYPPDVNGYDRK